MKKPKPLTPEQCAEREANEEAERTLISAAIGANEGLLGLIEAMSLNPSRSKRVQLSLAAYTLSGLVDFTLRRQMTRHFNHTLKIEDDAWK